MKHKRTARGIVSPAKREALLKEMDVWLRAHPTAWERANWYVGVECDARWARHAQRDGTRPGRARRGKRGAGT